MTGNDTGNCYPTVFGYVLSESIVIIKIPRLENSIWLLQSWKAWTNHSLFFVYPFFSYGERLTMHSRHHLHVFPILGLYGKPLRKIRYPTWRSQNDGQIDNISKFKWELFFVQRRELFLRISVILDQKLLRSFYWETHVLDVTSNSSYMFCIFLKCKTTFTCKLLSLRKKVAEYFCCTIRKQKNLFWSKK